MSRNIAAGNWKMNLGLSSAGQLTNEIQKGYHRMGLEGKKVILGVPFPFLTDIGARLSGEKDMYIAAQNMHEAESGAYTGEVSAAMLASVGCDYVILGHSERRAYFGETNESLAQKAKVALAHGLKVIFCVGETLAEREAGKTLDIVGEQVKVGLFALSQEEFADVVIAYEPVWAIGTGKTATPEQAQEVHAFIREMVADHFGGSAAAECSILYGGSVKPDNAAILFGQPDIDGGLVGGASLNADSFLQIIEAL